MTVSYDLKRAGRAARADADAVHGRPKPTKKQLRTANAAATPEARKGNGKLDLRHINKQTPEGARYLDRTRSFLRYYAHWPNEETLTLATLWVAMSHFVDDDGEQLFSAVPHMLLVGKHGTGKTRMMQEMSAVLRNPTALATRYTMPGIRDALHNHYVPVLDELHRTIGGRSGRENNAVQGVIAGAYKSGSGTLDGIGGMHQQAAFGQILMAAQPQIITNTNDLLDDLLERSIMIETEKSFDEVPPLDENFNVIGKNLHDILEVWGAAERPVPTKQNPKPKLWPVHALPGELQARTAEISEPLLAVADRAIDYMGQTEADQARWAIEGRAAVVKVFKGHGNDPSTLVDDVEARMTAMGMDLG